MSGGPVYGMAKDVETAVEQGCQENSKRLALGQEPQPPLYLVGQLGGVDVRDVRKGDDIKVKVGETVHEVIHLASPYEIGEDTTQNCPENSIRWVSTMRAESLVFNTDGKNGRHSLPVHSLKAAQAPLLEVETLHYSDCLQFSTGPKSKNSTRQVGFYIARK